MYNFEAALGSESEFQLFGWATKNPKTMEMKITKKDHSSDLVSMAVNIKETDNKYEFTSVIQQLEDKIDISCDLTTVAPHAKLFNVQMSSTYPGFELLLLSGHLLSSDPRITLLKLNGQTKSEWLETYFEWKCNTWLDGKKGLIDTTLDSKQVSVVAKVEWVWEWMRNIWGNLVASYTYNKMTKDVSTRLHLWNPKAKFEHLSFGTDISFNSKSWWLSSNVSLIAPSYRDMAIAIDLLLPHDPEIHSLIAKLQHSEKESYYNHIFSYSTIISKKNYQFVSEVQKDDKIHGLLYANVTSKSSFYLLDRYNITGSGITTGNTYDIRNSLKSNYMQNEILTRVVYEKPSTYHKILIHICYPPPVTVVSADIQFESTNNVFAYLNGTTPFQNFQNATFVLKAKTNEFVYDRYVKLAWHNKSALLDYNHLKTVEADRNVTHGVILVDFPLATQHVGKFVYKYEDRNKFSKGTSSLVFNSETIMKANFTKSSSVSHLSFENIYNIHIENNYQPVGLVYLHNVTYFKEGYPLPYLDKKVAEVFKLKNLTHKFIGELFIHKFENEENVQVNAMHTIRKLSLILKRGYKKVLETYGRLTLKPDVWAGYRLFISNQNKSSSTGNNLELNFAYPKRNVSLFGEYDMADKFIISNFGIISNDTSKSLSVVKEIRGSFDWHEQLKEYNYKVSDKSYKSIAKVVRMYPVHYARISIYHPSFKKNVTLSGEYSQNDIEFYNLKSTLEYSLDAKRKLSVSSVLEDKSSDNTKRYTFEAKATHPSSRLNLEMLGLHRRDSNVFEIVKNVSYSRSYLPLQYWNAHMRVSKIDKELELERESLRDLASLKGKYFNSDGVYKVNGSVIKGKDIRISGCFDADIPRKETGLIVNFTPDASERLHMEGFYRDDRNLFFKLWRVYDEDFITDASLFARLNHSRMLQSTLLWRPNMRNDLSSSAQSSWNYAWNYVLQTFDFWTDYMKNEASDTVYDVWSDAKPVVQEFIEDLRVLKNVQNDVDYFTKVFNESYKDNEFYMQDAYNMYLFLAEEISFRDKMGNLPKIFCELWEIMGETGETIRQSIVWLIENVKELYSKVLAFFSRLMKGEVLSEISHFITKMAGKYDKVIKDVHVSFIGYVEYLWYETATFLHNYWSTTLQVMEPTVIQLLHHLDSLVWEQSRKVFEFFNRSQQELLQSDYFAKNTNLTRDLEKFYKNVASNSFMGNLKNFAKMFLGMINDKIFSNIPFGYELGEIGKEIYGEVLELYKLPLINITVQTSQDVLERVMLVYTSFDIGGKVQRMIPVLYRHLADLSRNALNNNIKNHPSKTLFIFDPENGIVKLEQKLPVPWHRFNETPNFAEIPEYKKLIELQQLFSPSNITFWSMYYRYIPFIDPLNWLPPFKAHAIIIGSENFISFNKRHFSFPTRCSYLLAKDFVNNEFALILDYDPVKQSRSIVLLVDDETISVDLVQDSITISSNESVVLPVDLKCAYVYYEFGVVSIIGKRGFTLECNLKHDICTLFLEGWFFGKTAGLLGTMDNEPYNDFLSSDGKIHSDINKFVESWCIDFGCLPNKAIGYLKEPVDPEVEATCNMFFADKSSEFSVCFTVIDPAAFNDICKYSTDNEDSVCSAAVAYNQACTLVNIPLRTPFMCVKCPVANGSGIALKEGDFTELKDDDIPSSTDVIFIIESDACNSNLLEKRNFQSLITLLEEEFMLLGINNNRYAVVAFGGGGIFSTPHTVTIDNNEFTNAKTIIKYFEYVSLTIGKEPGNSDIFSAISFASKQRFRPGVSKTFILVPCSDCDPRNMSLDYSVLHEVLTEKNAVLHVLMNSEFNIEKSKINKILYGVDGDTAFTKNDVKATELKGDTDLRRQIKLTKSTLGYCTPLAFETNGTIFSATKLEQENFSLVKKFLSVFTRRVAQTAAPPTCQTCECTANTNGIDYVDCFPCFFPTAIYSDGGYYKDNFTLSFFQSFDPLGGGSETETDISL